MSLCNQTTSNFPTTRVVMQTMRWGAIVKIATDPSNLWGVVVEVSDTFC